MGSLNINALKKIKHLNNAIFQKLRFSAELDFCLEDALSLASKYAKGSEVEEDLRACLIEYFESKQ